MGGGIIYVRIYEFIDYWKSKNPGIGLIILVFKTYKICCSVCVSAGMCYYITSITSLLDKTNGLI